MTKFDVSGTEEGGQNMLFCVYALNNPYMIPRKINVSHLHLSAQSQKYCKITVLTLNN